MRRPNACSRRLVIALFALGVAVQCSRHAEIGHEPEPYLTVAAIPTQPEGGIPTVAEQELVDGFPACADRPLGRCAGPEDLPCDFVLWVQETSDECRAQTNCQAGGWLEVDMNDQGCVSRVGLVDSTDAFVSCLVQKFGAYRCPCGAMSDTYYSGVAASSCPGTFQ